MIVIIEHRSGKHSLAVFNWEFSQIGTPLTLCAEFTLDLDDEKCERVTIHNVALHSSLQVIFPDADVVGDMELYILENT